MVHPRLRPLARAPAARWLLRSARDLGLRAGLVRYRPGTWSDARWDEWYRGGASERYGRLDELARYSLIVGYVAWFGPRPSVLDVGCGEGLLRRRLPAESFSRYVGVDPVAPAIEAARALEDPRTTFVLGDVLTAELAPADVVVCNEVLNLVPDPRALTDRLVELVRPGGVLLTSLWRHPGDRQLWRLLDRRFDPVDRVVARNPANDVAARGWTVAAHRSRA
jgi:2-polyprenyl-6-hydroxyphenyl methylase/3-demethylubiquinone-9 3-methyltransferase